MLRVESVVLVIESIFLLVVGVVGQLRAASSWDETGRDVLGGGVMSVVVVILG